MLRFLPLTSGLAHAVAEQSVVVCGHTHMHFDRGFGALRVVNAGSVGMPFGAAGAHWLLLGPRVTPMRTTYDAARATKRIERTQYPGEAAFAASSVSNPPSEEAMLAAFEAAPPAARAASEESR